MLEELILEELQKRDLLMEAVSVRSREELQLGLRRKGRGSEADAVRLKTMITSMGRTPINKRGPGFHRLDRRNWSRRAIYDYHSRKRAHARLRNGLSVGKDSK